MQVAQLAAEQVLHAEPDPFVFPPLTDIAKVESSRLTRRLLHSGQRSSPAASRLSHNCSNLWSHAWQWNSYNGIEHAFPALSAQVVAGGDRLPVLEHHEMELGPA